MRRIVTGLVVLGLGAAGCGLLPGEDRNLGDDGREPAWRTRVYLRPGDDGQAAAATADTVVVRIGRSVVALDRRTGSERWRYQGRAGDTGAAYVDVAVTGDVVAVSDHVKGDGTWLDVLDTASGRKLWSHRAGVGDVTVLRDAVYTADCGRDCVVSRHDPRTGRSLWALRAPSGTLVERPDLGARIGRSEPRALEAGPAGTYVLLRSGDGRSLQDRVTVLEAKTGRRLAQARYTGSTGIVTPTTLVVGEPVDDRAEDPACRYALRGHDVRDGTRRWRGEVSAHHSKRDDRAGCSGLLSDGTYALGIAPDTLFATTVDGRPQAFDLTAGRSRWAAPRRGVPIDAGGGLVLVRDGRDRGAIRALDAATGRQLWQGVDPGRPSTVRTVVLGASVLVWYNRVSGDRYAGRVSVLGAADGRRRWVARSDSGILTGAGDGWFTATPLQGTPEGAQDIVFYEVPA